MAGQGYKQYFQDENNDIPATTARRFLDIPNERYEVRDEMNLNLEEADIQMEDNQEININDCLENVIPNEDAMEFDYFRNQEQLEILDQYEIDMENGRAMEEENMEEELLEDYEVEMDEFQGRHARTNDEEDDFTFLKNYLTNEDVYQPINVPLSVNRVDIMLMILTYSFAHSCALSEVTNLFNLINSMFEYPILPKSRYTIDKLFNPMKGATYHALCDKCETHVGKYQKGEDKVLNCLNTECDNIIHVKKVDKHFFITVDPSSMISNLLQKYWKEYTRIINDRDARDGVYTDFVDGDLYKKFVDKLDPSIRQQYATYTFNADGALDFKKETSSMWLVQMIINELPINQKLVSPILCGIWYGDKKPNMNSFLSPFIEQMKTLSEVGVTFRVQDEEKNVKVFGLCCCVDSAARPPMQGLIQFNGKFGCNWCLHPGDWSAEHHALKYLTKRPLPALREHETSIKDMISAVEIRQIDPNRTVNGFKDVSQLILLPSFNIITGFVPDYMHSMLLGIGRQLAEVWFNAENILPYSLKRHLSEIDEQLALVKPPRQMARLTRPKTARKHWNAREWENWILFYSIPFVNQYFPLRYLDHWIKFVSSLYILLQSELTSNEINMAHELLVSFVETTELLYGIGEMTFNVHQMYHVADSVRTWGPLFAHSGFPFESGNGIVLKKIHAAKGVHEQIKRYFLIKVALQKIELLFPQNSVEHYCNSISSRICIHTTKLSKPRYFGYPKPVDVHLREVYDLSNDAKLYSRMVMNEVIYCTSERQCKRSNNSFAQLNDDTFIQILQFIVDDINNVERVQYSTVKVRNAFPNLYTFMKSVTSIINENKTVETSFIKKPCIIVEINDQKYIYSLPNTYHY